MPIQLGVEAAAQAMAQARILAEVEFGDADLVVTEHPDGLFTLNLSDSQVVLDGAALAKVMYAFIDIGRTKGWLT